ncbi:MAG: hypothetical protein ABI620_05460 [Chloroflexota bacterium]
MGFFLGVMVGFMTGSYEMLRRCRRLAKRLARDHDLAEVKKCLKHRSGERPAVKLVARP